MNYEKNFRYFLLATLCLFWVANDAFAQVSPSTYSAYRGDRDGDGVPESGGKDKCPDTHTRIQGREAHIKVNGKMMWVPLPKDLNGKFKHELGGVLRERAQLLNKKRNKKRELYRIEKRKVKGRDAKRKKKADIAAKQGEILKIDSLVAEMDVKRKNLDPRPYFEFFVTLENDKRVPVKLRLDVDAFGCLPDSDQDGVPDLVDRCPNKAGDNGSSGCPDRDKDGIPDQVDLCPDVKGGKKTKGCPDRDKDGVADKDDECPDLRGVAKLNGCPDADGDGVPDKEDDCPDVKGLAAFKGCPDSDGDGIMDKKDDCPDVKGSSKYNGCPDTDGDGIIDKKDECPQKAGLAEFNGCPDRDKDGVPDKVDNCPDVPGVKDNRGCPEILERASKVLFAPGKAIINPVSYGVLNELAALLKKYSNTKIYLEGHTDNQGDDASNLKLSKDRAKAVADYLIKKGIAKIRIESTGYGETKPIADNNTPAGRKKNRRVDMRLTNQ
ncbi:MAG TPA: hypothetical protein DCS93_04610 [Microscillaceae bacterium]|nr:hypothetical protein [Microscillaceae bacterium]